MTSLDSSYRASTSRRNTDIGGGGGGGGGENELARSHQHLLLQLLLVMAAFIWQTQWMLQYNGLIDVAKKPKSWNVFDNVGRVLSETALIDL